MSENVVIGGIVFLFAVLLVIAFFAVLKKNPNKLEANIKTPLGEASIKTEREPDMPEQTPTLPEEEPAAENKPAPAGSNSVNITGDVSGSTIITGDNNVIGSQAPADHQGKAANMGSEPAKNSGSLSEIKRQALEKQKNALVQEYTVVNDQLVNELSAGNQEKLKRQLAQLEEKIAQLDADLAALG